MEEEEDFHAVSHSAIPTILDDKMVRLLSYSQLFSSKKITALQKFHMCLIQL